MSSPSIPDRLADLLKRTPPFDSLSDTDRRALVAEMNVAFFEPGAIILEQGVDVHRALYVVESGLVRLMNVEEKRLIDMCGPGAQFGSYGIMQGGVLPYEARAVEQTSLALLAADTFRKLLKEHEAVRLYFEEDLKRYVRTLDTALDASGAFLLFDTPLASLIRREAVTVEPDDSVQAAALAMSQADADTVVIVQDGTPMGVVTEGDLVDKVVADGTSIDTPVMGLVERPPIALRGSERLFDAVRTMMRHRIRRVIVMMEETGQDDEQVHIGLLSTDDISHYRGLDPVATTELIERAMTVEALAAIRSESNRRLLRLYQQGVQSEDLLGVIAEIDDQLKRRILRLVERRLRKAHKAEAFDGPWAWLSFGTPGRCESTLYARQDNGLVYADPEPGDAERAAAWYARLAQETCDALEQCGFAPAESGILARHEAFRQPLSAWQDAYAQWASGAEASSTARAAVCFDVRRLYGDDHLTDALRETVKAHLPNDRLRQILLRQGLDVNVPLSFFGRFELDRRDDGREGFDLRERGLKPVVGMARALALDAGYLRSANTFDRLRYLVNEGRPAAAEARSLLAAFTTLSDLHLRLQMQAAEVGEPPSDWMDPGTLHRSQQNLLKETLKALQTAQKSLASRYKAG